MTPFHTHRARTPSHQLIPRLALCALASSASAIPTFDQTLEPESIAGSSFGYSVAADGDLIAVGAPSDDTDGLNAGAAYLFRRNPTTGTYERLQRLIPSGLSVGDGLGEEVSIFGTTVIVTALNTDTPAQPDGQGGMISGAANTGAAHVFNYDELTDTWIHTQTLYPTEPNSEQRFGYAAKLMGDRLIVGDNGDGRIVEAGDGVELLELAGAAYIFDRAPNTGTFHLVQRLAHANPVRRDVFGTSVAVWEDTAIIGAYRRDTAEGETGALFVFERDPATNTWTQTRELTPDFAQDGDWFGWCVGMDATQAVVSSKLDVVNGVRTGSATIFNRSDWSVAGRLEPIGAQSDAEFGVAVTLANGRAAIGAVCDDMGAGRMYCFERVAGETDPELAWVQTAALQPPTIANEDRFARSTGLVVTNGVATAAVAGSQFNDLLAPSAGLATVFTWPAPCSAADAAEPYGVLNFADVQSFLGNFAAGTPTADLAAPTGVFNFADVQAYLGLFRQGC